MASPFSSSKKVKVAVVQACPKILDLHGTLDKVDKICKEAGCNGKGAELILFPEAFVSWYPRNNTFGMLMGLNVNRDFMTQGGAQLFRKYWENSVLVPSPEVDRLGLIARQNKLHLVIGVIERETNSATLYCTILYFDDEGTFLGKHRKVMPTAVERISWGYGDGSTLPVFDTKVGRIGGLICGENYMPLARMSHYHKGVQIYFAPTADDREAWHVSARHIAMEGNCFVLTCNQFIKLKDYPRDTIDFGQTFPSDDPEFPVSMGGSAIIAPDGKVLAGPNYTEETVLYADIDLGEIIPCKLFVDPIGHYARPDIFTLTVNERKNEPVVFVNSSSEMPKSTASASENAKNKGSSTESQSSSSLAKDLGSLKF